MNRLIFALLLVLLVPKLFAQGREPRQVLFEEFTGAWCGWCPRGSLILEELMGEFDRVIPVVVHSGPGLDPMRTDEGDQLTEELLVWYPTAAIDRFRFDTYPTPPIPDSDWREKLQERLSLPPEAQVVIDQTYSSDSKKLNLTVEIRFLETSKGSFSINAYVVEDLVSGGELYDQRNKYNDNPDYPDFYQRGDPIAGYIHRHVLRRMLGGRYGINPEGDQHIPESVSRDESYSCRFETEIETSWNPAHLTLVAYVMRKGESGDAEILNAASQPMISASDFSLNQNPGFRLYPNPSEGILYLEKAHSLTQDEGYQIFDLSGRVLQQGVLRYQADQNRYQLDVGRLPKGVYVFQFQHHSQKLYIY